MRRRVALLGLVGLAGSFVGCSSTGDSEDCPATSATDPFGAELYLGLSPAEQSAVVRISGTVDGDEVYCSGVFVAADKVLTARHCADLAGAPDAIVSSDNYVSPILAADTHEEVDLMLLSVEGDDPPEPLPTVQSMVSGSWLGRRAVIGGFGRTADFAAGERHFSVQTIVATADRIETEPIGSFAPCSGDSGGPLIGRGVDGVRVLGLLSTTSPDCRGSSAFTAVASLGGWWGATSTPQPFDPGEVADCEDRCVDDVAVQCTGSGEEEQDCRTCGLVCGLSSVSARAGCY